MYTHLESFTTIFNDLAVLGCPTTSLINAVLAVAKTNADAGCDLDLGTDCDLKLRLRFFDSVLYKDFQEQRVGGLLKAAKLALERPKRERWKASRTPRQMRMSRNRCVGRELCSRRRFQSASV